MATRASMFQWLAGILALTLTAVLASVLTLAAVFLNRQDDHVPLTTDLGSGWKEIDRNFDARVRQQFPPGSPERVLVAELKRQGFVPTQWTATALRSAAREEHRLPCVYDADVKWEAREGQITLIEGRYSGVCV